MKSNEPDGLAIQFEISKEKLNKMKNILSFCNISDRKELIETALVLLETIVEEKKKGRLICALDEKSKEYHEIYMKSLEPVSKIKKKANISLKNFVCHSNPPIPRYNQ